MAFGQDPVFFDLLDRQAQIAVQAAQQLAILGKDFGGREATAKSLKKLEEDADSIVHELVTKADAKFITPFDKEDFHALSHAMDEVTDLIEAAGARVSIYRLDKVRPDFAPMADLLRQCAEATAQGVAGLRNLKEHKKMEDGFKRVHTLENQADDLYRSALGSLFNEDDADPLMVMKWKEVYDRVEIATDSCEQVANLLENMVVKYA
jgi:predicted phosphate transport protein (TIGR00153 family)